MKTYTVAQLAKISGVSIRTLHHYDKIGLLRPRLRTYSRYRQYGPQELIRLQQILFYKELDFALQEIAAVLDDPEFDLVQAMETHKRALLAKQERLGALLLTIDKTLAKLKGETTMQDEELYHGLSQRNGSSLPARSD